MIDTDKLLGREQKQGTILSETSITNLGVIRKRLVNIDGMLKDKLVLSKVRDAIKRQDDERLIRLQREKDIEEDDDDGIEGQKKRKKPKPDDDSGGTFAFLTSLLSGLFLPFRNIGALRVATTVLSSIGSIAASLFKNLSRAINLGYSAVTAIETQALKMFGDKGLQTLKQFQSVFTRFVNVAVITAAVSAGSNVLGGQFFKKASPILNKTKVKGPGAGNFIRNFNRVKKEASKVTANAKKFASTKITQGRRFFDFETAADFAKRTGRPFPNIATGEKFIPRRNITNFFDKRFLTPASNLLQRGKKGIASIGDTLDPLKNIFKAPKFKQREIFKSGDLIFSKLTPTKDMIPTRAARIRDFDAGMRIGDLVDDVPRFIQALLKRVKLTPKNLSKILKPVLTPFRKILRRFPIIGPLLDFGLGIALGDSLGMAAFSTVGSTLFGFLGAAIGSLVPGPGTFVGGLVGGILGDTLSRMLYKRIFAQGIAKRMITIPDPEADQKILDIEGEIGEMLKKEKDQAAKIAKEAAEEKAAANLFERLTKGTRNITKKLFDLGKKSTKILKSGGGEIPDIGSYAYYDDPNIGSVKFIPVSGGLPSIASAKKDGLISPNIVVVKKNSQHSLYAGGLLS